MKKRKKKKSTIIKYAEYYAANIVFTLAGTIPLAVSKAIAAVLGDILFFAVRRRREIAIGNLTHAFGNEKSPQEIRHLARASCRSFIYTFLEIVKFRYLFSGQGASAEIRKNAGNVDALFKKAKQIHDEAGGCIFVTPHIGNWEVLPRVSSVIGIPLAIVARPLDNELLEQLIFRNRVAEGQFFVPKKNALFALQKALQKGTSIGMLPDQSTMKGLSIEFFGRPATTTPVPAILAITYKRPIVVVAACRKRDGLFEGFVSDAIWPAEYCSEKAEIIRITEEVTRAMEVIIRKYPDQYLWMHNRWKTYQGKKEIMT